ncbi:catalase-like domain-containing protein [Vararia minispora EC-137]|uniref:Catalase-like domain-containing protein n=1 Tax=Vararia minispora EC-137 TaxID=1314806 RepID=A0ACB8QL48_9AGAM|nr:catalase-like domain-containing protein [Vararia minispora EC-137]
MTTAAVKSFFNTTKVADLSRDTVEVDERTGLTTDHGVPVSDTDNWLKVTNGQYSGPSLLEDQVAREKIHRFDHERIPERVRVHARGAGAHGYFKVFDDRAKKYTFAGVLTDPSRTTPVFVRFSTVQGSRGSADTVRDVRGFATKFYTEEGNWDIVGNNIPVFFIQDAIKFPDFVHAVKPEPHNEVPQGQTAHDNFWDFVGLQPEASHMVMWAMSDRAIPRSYRMMQGFGVNTFTFMNVEGKRFFVKFRWIPELGVNSLVWDEALKIAGQDPDFHRKDLEEAISNGAPPKWTFGIQVIPEEKEHEFEFDVLDATKIWPEELVPIEEIGEMILDKTRFVGTNFFPETEQVAFCTAHVVPGIGFSDDPLLQGRNFSYFDTQISRLGINWEQLPINRPVCPLMNHNRDGQHQMRIRKGQVNYWPNRFSAGSPADRGGYVEFAQRVAGIKSRARGEKFNEHYNQAELFLNSLTKHERLHLIGGFSFELDHCDDPVVYESYTKVLSSVNFDRAKTVAEAVGGEASLSPEREHHGKQSASLSQIYYAPKKPTIKSRRIAILIADGFSKIEVESIRTLLKTAGAFPFLISMRRSKIYPADEKGDDLGVFADHHFEGQRSTLFDAILVPSGQASADILMASGRCIHWVREAFGHLKVIGAIGEGMQVLARAIKVEVPQISFASPDDSSATDSYGVVTVGKYSLLSIAREVLQIATGGDQGFLSDFAYEISKHRNYERELDGLVQQVAY